MAHQFKHPIIGQEAICPDGLGRVVAFKDEFPYQWIQVETYINNRGCTWSPQNVELIDPRGIQQDNKAPVVRREYKEVATVGDLRAYIQDLPGEMPVGRLTYGHVSVNKVGDVGVFVGEVELGGPESGNVQVILRVSA